MAVDLTGSRWLRRVVKNPLFPAVLQWFTLAVFLLLILYGWNYHGIRGIDLPDPLAYTNVATLFFWVIWLMGLILLVPFIGRLWCTVCPLGYLNDLFARTGFRLRYPRSLKNMYLAAVLLVFYNGLVALFGINRFPDYSARLLVGIVLILVLVAVVFRGRIFCGYLCPIGAMVGVYSRTSPWRLDVRDREVCRSCPTKACYQGDTRWYRLATPVASISFPFRRPGCQVDLFPPELVEDPRCVMCTQCIKNCPYDNIRWGSRPFLRGVVEPSVPHPSEAFFLAVLMGTTTGIFTRVWPALSSLLASPGEGLVGLLGIRNPVIGASLQLVWSAAVVPLLFLGGLSLMVVFLARSSFAPIQEPTGGSFGERMSFGLASRARDRAVEAEGWQGRRLRVAGVFSAFALSFIPLFLTAHASFALVKVNEKLAYLPGALRDPSGVKLYLAIHRFGMMAAPKELLPLSVVRWPILFMMASGAAASVYCALRLSARVYPDQIAYRRWGALVFSSANVALGVLFLFLVRQWLF